MSNLAICFFGQVKNYDNIIYTGYKDNIEDILKKNFLNIDYYIVTYNNIWFTNPRNKEDGPINYTSIFDYFTFHKSVILDINDPDIEHIDEFSKLLVDKYGGCWQEHSYLSTKFAIRQIYTLNKLSAILDNTNYDKYIFLRPDALFRNQIHMKYIENDIDMLTPSFGQAGGFNDRFAILSYNGMKTYTSRYDNILSKPIKYHSENFLKKISVEANISYDFIDNFTFDLIRLKIK